MSIKTKTKRLIYVKDPQLRKFRTALREILKIAQVSECRRLRDLSNTLEVDDFEVWLDKKKKIEEQIDELVRARNRAPIGCRVCGHQDLDLIFNPCSSQWYCEGCYTFNQVSYKENPPPYVSDWKKLYP